MDAALLARIQFAVTSGFHFIYPPISIGLGIILVIMEGMWLKTKDTTYLSMTKFWAKIFGLVFALGVATGIVLEFEFGTNWSNYSRFVGDIFGSALAAEGIFAFFLESGFLAIVLFGWDKVKPGMHFFATVMVCLGAHISAIWIIVANSWMQTPAGFHIVQEGSRLRAEITDFWAVVFNPSTVDRLSHTISASWQTGAWLVIAISAYYLLKKRHIVFAKSSLKIALIVAVAASFMQLGTGHLSAVTISKTQPAKLAAFEGHYPVSAPAPLYLFGWVDEENKTVHGLGIPGALGFLIALDPTLPVTGLDAFPVEDRPPVQPVFQAYHLMVAIGMGLIGLSILVALALWKGWLADTKWLLQLCMLAVLGPQIANMTGWASAEIGRQPWIVYGVMRTAQGLSPVVSSTQILISLIGFIVIFTLLFAAFLYILAKKIKAGPEEANQSPHHLSVDDGTIANGADIHHLRRSDENANQSKGKKRGKVQ